MKKIFPLMMALMVALLTWSCSDDDDKDALTDPSQIPSAARIFLSQYFADDEPVKTVRESDGSFDVTLKSGIQVDFDSKGSWTEVEGTLAAPLPNQEFIPQAIRTYVEKNYPFEINAISRDKSGYEVTLTSLLELNFDLFGKFLGVDN